MTTTAQGFEARLERFRQLTRGQGLSFAVTVRKMGISKTTSGVYERTLIERTGETRAQHLFRRWQELVDAGMPKSEAGRQLRISRATYFRWERDGGPRRKAPNFGPGDVARGTVAQRARRNERLERFRTLTRDQGLTIRDACAELDITTKTGNDYEHELTHRTGLTLRQHRMGVYKELREFLPRREAAEWAKIHRTTAGGWDRELGLTDQILEGAPA